VAAIKPEILKRNFTTTPRKVTSAILSLCNEINPAETLVEVPVRPDKDAIVSECFNNVSEKVNREGGNLLYGWTIWEWPRVFIEAEHHAVWEKDGKLVDITPKDNGERRILFLPDPTRTYDFEGQKRTINIKRNLGRFPSVAAWIAATDEYHTACERNSVGNVISFEPLEMQAFQHKLMNTMLTVIVDLAAETKPRERCFCTSGKEYRKCCSKFIRFDA